MPLATTAPRWPRSVSVAPPDHEAEDELLLARFIDEDASPGTREAAFHTLVDRYHRRLFAVCVRLLHSADDAEDAVQETFIRLARNATTFRGDARLSTWLYRVAHNVCTDHVRYNRRRPSTPVDDVAAVAGDVAADDHLVARETALTLRAALEQLDERSRTLLLLVSVEGLAYDEVAALTGLATGTVKSRVSRARVRLGELLAIDHGATTGPDRPTGTRGATPPRKPAHPRGPPGPSAQQR